MEYLGNAFSLQMLQEDGNINIQTVSPSEVPEAAASVIGHADTARVVGAILGREVPCNRASITLAQGDVLYVAQVMGGRLPEGATTLPEGFRLTFKKVTLA